MEELLVDPDPPVYPYFESVPVELDANLEWRAKIRDQCSRSKIFRADIEKMCAEDSLFWLATFCWLFEPRPRPREIPFIPWPHQLPVWSEMERWLGYADVGLEKSRAEGASWMIDMIILHKWLYLPGFTAGMVSKDEETCDDGTVGSLMGKLDWQLDRLPLWMVPPYQRNRTHHTLKNVENEALITGFAATGTVGTGNRFTCFVFDELAKFNKFKSSGGSDDKKAMDSTQQTTQCRFLISTPFGPEGEYYKAMKLESSIKKCVLHWSMNPVRTIGEYKVYYNRDKSVELELVDLDYWLKRAHQHGYTDATKADLPNLARKVTGTASDDPEDNPFGYAFMLGGDFVKHGKSRSVWYDGECRRAGATPKGIAQELDLDYGGSASRFFDINLLERLQRDECRAPECRGELLHAALPDTHNDLKKPRFSRTPTGNLLLWFEPDIYDRPPQATRYVIGADISAGTGGVSSSNSCLSVFRRETGMQVAELATPHIMPADLAELAVALCYWFMGRSGPAFLIWEANGPPGQQFTKRVAQLNYNHIYFRAKGGGETLDDQASRLPGWWSNTKTKPKLLGEFARAIDTGECVIQSHQTIEEAKFYMNLPGGKIEHIAASTEDDPSGAGERHGDRVIGAAVAWWEMKEYRAIAEEPSDEAPPNSFAARQAERFKQARRDQPSYMPRSARRRAERSRRRHERVKRRLFP